MGANSDIDFDLIVIGGGLVGACCAVLLSAQPEFAETKIALLDADPPTVPPPDDEVDLRVSAISRASQKILAAAGAWNLLPAVHRVAYTDMVVWDALGKAETSASLHFSAAQTSEPNLGYIIENRRLLWALYATPCMRDRVAMLRGTVAGLELGSNFAAVEFTDRRRLRTRLVIAADGANSACRKLAGIETRGWEYQQRAIVAHVHGMATISAQRTAGVPSPRRWPQFHRMVDHRSAGRSAAGSGRRSVLARTD
jgi:2-octaprenylphenol hydroxylase